MASKKYDPLKKHLEAQSSPQIPLPFAAIGRGHTRSFYGCMKGMITVAEGYDLTDPADPHWHHQAEQP